LDPAFATVVLSNPGHSALAPFGTGISGTARTGLIPSAYPISRSMPSETSPIILRGSRLTTNNACFPSISFGLGRPDVYQPILFSYDLQNPRPVSSTSVNPGHRSRARLCQRGCRPYLEYPRKRLILGVQLSWDNAPNLRFDAFYRSPRLFKKIVQSWLITRNQRKKGIVDIWFYLSLH
jgi:hypothetical protein